MPKGHEYYCIAKRKAIILITQCVFEWIGHELGCAGPLWGNLESIVERITIWIGGQEIEVTRNSSL